MVKKKKIAHARRCMMGGCYAKNADLYSKRTDLYNSALYLCPCCAREIGLLNGLTDGKTDIADTQVDINDTSTAPATMGGGKKGKKV